LRSSSIPQQNIEFELELSSIPPFPVRFKIRVVPVPVPVPDKNGTQCPVLENN
jgi:hypothetical protein